MPLLLPFERCVEQFGPAVLRFCVAQLGPQRADDCFQDTMLAALRAYPELRDPAATRAWLFAIAARKATDLHRAGARAPTPVADPQPTTTTPAREPDAGLWQLVRGLPEKQRLAVTLRHVAELSHREIGDAMGTSEEAARRNVHEALNRLRQELSR